MADLPLPGTYRLVLRCRAGLAGILAEELRSRRIVAGPRTPLCGEDPASLGERGKIGQPGRLIVEWSRPLAPLFEVRTFSTLAFALPCPATVANEAELCESVVAALTAPATRKLFGAFGMVGTKARYRLHFADGGHRHALVYGIASRVRQIAPELVNDPHDSPWQVEIYDRGPFRIELVPQKLFDPRLRFAYRRRDVPASSHAPLAAALARLATVGPDDVVWDPFVGAGSELIEIALASPCRNLFGSDLDESALARARENADAAQVREIQLFQADSLHFRPPVPRLTRIVTNPPMGRRTRTRTPTGRDRLSEFLAAFIAHAAKNLAPGGRLIWISPQPRLTAECARSAALRLLSAQPVDLNGFWGSLEVWERRGA